MKNVFFPDISRYPSTNEIDERRQATAEIERLRDVAGSLAEDLRIALGIMERQGVQEPRMLLTMLKQNVETAEREISSHEVSHCSDEDASASLVINLQQKRRQKRRRRKEADI